MSESFKNRELLSPEQVNQNLRAYLDNVKEIVKSRGSEEVKINLVFIAEKGMHINCFYTDRRKIESIERYSDTKSSISHDRNNPFSIKILSAGIGSSENLLRLRSADIAYEDERIAVIDIANPEILNNLDFNVELD